MNKEKIYKILYGISIFLIIVFVIMLVIDYFYYDIRNNSAPFYAFILVRILEILIPSILVFIIAKIVKKKYGKN